MRELWCIIGRRGGKPGWPQRWPCYFALFVKHKLAVANAAWCWCCQPRSTDQGRVRLRARASCSASEVLRKEIASTTRSEIRLKNGIIIAIHANSFRSVRGRTLCACIFDEVAYWRDDTTATPDTETYTAVLPALITTNGMLVAIGSPYRRIGLLHAKHKQYFGTDSDDTLVVQGSTLTFNRTLDAAAIAAQQQADPTAARREWDAEIQRRPGRLPRR